MNKKIKILAYPAFINKKSVPYNSSIYSNLQKMDCEIEEYQSKKIKNILEEKYDIFHIHWAEQFFNAKSTIYSIKETIIFITKLLILKLNGAKILWTVHNIRSHENRHPLLEDLFWNIFPRLIDGYISLSKIGIKDVRRCFPSLKNKKTFIIPLWTLGFAYPNKIGKIEARKKLMIKKDENVILFIGQIRPYKGLKQLITSFEKIKEEKIRLLIAGKPLNDEVKNEISLLIKKDKRISFYPEFIEEDKIQVFINASDIMIAPYEYNLNSGAIFLALPFKKPIIVPENKVFKEINKKVGENYILTYKSPLNEKNLKKAIENGLQKRKKPLLTEYSLKKVSEKTLQAYKEILCKN